MTFRQGPTWRRGSPLDLWSGEFYFGASGEFYTGVDKSERTVHRTRPPAREWQHLELQRMAAGRTAELGNFLHGAGGIGLGGAVALALQSRSAAQLAGLPAASYGSHQAVSDGADSLRIDAVSSLDAQVSAVCS